MRWLAIRLTRNYSDEQRSEMVRLYESGLTTVAVASLVRMPSSSVWFILKRMGVAIRPTSHYLRGRPLSPEHIRKCTEGHRGKKRPESFRRKMSEAALRRGSLHNFYVDGNGRQRDTKRKREMDQFEYRLWRERVFARDDFTCRSCGKRGGRLNADHIRPWKTHPALRYDVSNGQTLCRPCHHATPTYGSKVNRAVAAA